MYGRFTSKTGCFLVQMLEIVHQCTMEHRGIIIVRYYIYNMYTLYSPFHIYIYVTSTTFFASTNNGLLATEQAAGWACWSTARHGANDQTIQRRFFSSAVSVESSATNSGLIYLKEVIYEKKTQ